MRSISTNTGAITLSNKTLVVCGDSFAALDQDLPGSHFSELLANDLDYRLVSLARAGLSNAAIRLQIDQAIKLQPDFIVYVATDHYRYEVPLNSLYPNLDQRHYDLQNGIDNIDYSGWGTPAEKDRDFTKASLYSVHYSKFESDSNLPVNFTDAWKKFFTTLNDEGWKEQTDHWIIESGVNCLIDSQIPFLFVPNDLTITLPSRLDDKQVYSQSLTNLSYSQPTDARYHTAAQEQIYRDIKEKIIELFHCNL